MKVAICFATGYEEVEAISVVDVLRRAEIECCMIGVTGMDVTSGRGITIKMDQHIEEVDEEEFDMIIFPGGVPGVDNLYANERVKQLAKSFAKNKYVAAICAAPGVLGKLGILEGRKAVCYPGVEGQLKGAEVGETRVCVDDNIITAVGAGASLEFGLKIVEVIKGKELSEKIQKAMLVS